MACSVARPSDCVHDVSAWPHWSGMVHGQSCHAAARDQRCSNAAATSGPALTPCTAVWFRENGVVDVMTTTIERCHVASEH